MARPNSASAISAHITGMREAKAKFQALPGFMQEKRINVNTATAQAVALGATQRLIASPSVQTRSLLNHVKWSVSKSNGQAKVGVSSGSTTVMFGHMGGITRKIKIKGILIAGKGGSALTSQGAKLIRPSRYAHLVEFGTVHFEAEPFMLPAATAQKDLHLQRWRAAGRELEREMAGLSSGPTTGGGLL